MDLFFWILIIIIILILLVFLYCKESRESFDICCTDKELQDCASYGKISGCKNDGTSQYIPSCVCKEQ